MKTKKLGYLSRKQTNKKKQKWEKLKSGDYSTLNSWTGTGVGGGKLSEYTWLLMKKI